MTKIIFTPFSILGGLLAGMLARQLFSTLWGVIDEEKPPEPADREVSWSKVALALLLQGAIFRAVRGLVDRAMRTGFRNVTGAWPGERRPKSA